jgi:alpha-tubulin suppressor-like RCC1 family protein
MRQSDMRLCMDWSSVGGSRLRIAFAVLVLVGCKDGCASHDDVPKSAPSATSAHPAASSTPSASASASSSSATIEPPDGDPLLTVTPGPAHRFIAASSHTCVIDPARKVHCWGSDFETTTTIDGITDAVSIAAGSSHTCVLTTSGRVACFGANTKGQLGDGTTTARKTPTFVPHLRAVAIAAGADGTCAISAEHNVMCWGSAAPNKTIGDASTLTTTPTAVLDDGGKKIAATTLDIGDDATCALAPDKLTCWGSGRNFAPHRNMRMAAFSMDDATPDEPLTVTFVGSRVAVGASNCVLTASNSPSCWGPNDQGQRGDATNETSAMGGEGRISFAFDSKSDAVTDGPDVQATDIAASRNEVCVATIARHVMCWGANDDGELGIGTKAARKAPGDVKGITTAVAVAVGDRHACAVLADGSVTCWGDNGSGQSTSNAVDGDVLTPRIVREITARTSP